MSREGRESPSTGQASQSRDAFELLTVSTIVLFGWLGFYFLTEGGEVNTGHRALAGGLGALLVLGRTLIPRGAALRRRVATLLVIAWAATLIGAVGGRDLHRSVDRYESRLWSYVHYYLGAKYFTELGYDGLYDQMLAVDAEHQEQWLGIHATRNLKTYVNEPTNLRHRLRGEQWSDERWTAFSQDVLWFQGKVEGRDGVPGDKPRLKLRSWRRLFKDRGYNPTPSGNTLYWVLAQTPLSERNLVLLGLLDPLLLLLIFGVAARVFGLVRSMTALAWLLLFFGNEFHVVGGPFLYDYLVALLLMACAVHSNRPMLGGIALGYAAMTRVFPALLLPGFLLWALVRWREARKIPRFVDRFLRGLAGACLVLFLLGCLNGRGVKAWAEWGDNIALHSDHHRFGNKRIGLQHVFTHDVNHIKEGRWGRKGWRRRTWPKQKVWWMGSAALLLVLWGIGTWRRAGGERDPLASLLFTMLVVFVAVVLSRYYWSALCLLFLVGGRERDGPWEGFLGAGLLVVVAAFYLWTGDIESSFGRYFVANLLVLAWWLPVLLFRAVVRPEGPVGVEVASPVP